MPSQNKINILYYLMYWGPLETFIHNQMRDLPENFEPSIVALHHYQHYTEGIYRSKKVEILNKNRLKHIFHSIWQRINFNSNKYAAHPLRLRRIQDIFSERKPDIIHAHFGQMGLNVLPAAISANIPILTSFHGNDASSLLENSRYKSSLKSLFAYKKSYIIAVSRRIQKRLIDLGASPTRCFCHYIGTDLQHFMPRSEVVFSPLIDKERVDFLQISNFVPKKGHFDTLLAFRRLVDKFPHVYLTLVGEGPTQSECQILAEKLNLNNNVKFPGKVEHLEVKTLMNSADVFVHHSITPTDKSEEGIPTVIMEAMACGLPILSTYHAGIPELVQDGINGFLANEKDIDQYYENMEKILHTDVSQMSQSSRNMVEEKFNLRAQNEKLYEIYYNIVRGKI